MLEKRGKKLDRFIITHYDNDHIQSAGRLIKENGKFAEPAIITIDQVWLNTFRHLQSQLDFPDKATPDVEALLNEFMAEHSDFTVPGEEYEINAEQAAFLGKDLIANGYPWNTDFGKKAACVENGGPVIINGNVKVTLLSPTVAGLKVLEDEFKAALAKYHIGLSGSTLIDDAFELFVQQGGKIVNLPEGYEIAGTPAITAEIIRKMSDGSGYMRDTAAANGSSIAFILEADEKRILMLADAHAETIMEQLKVHFPDEKEYPIFFDAVKVAHHGSYRNNHPELFKMIDSPVFLFSTNALHQSHQHPDLQTIALIVNRQLSHGMTSRELIFNYTIDHLEGLDQDALMQEFNYTVKKQTFIELP